MSVRELTEQTLREIDRANPTLNAFITITHEQALGRADELDGMLARGEDLGPLHGIPIAHKDCIYTKGVRTTGGSKIYADFVPDHDAEVVRRLHAAGTVMVGKTGLHEFTYGISNVNPHYGPVRNPHDHERVSGGSSGGSGAAVAAGLVMGATGTDTGGSIRIPASFCGCVGLKPTFDRIPRDGVMALGQTQDHMGPMAATVADAARLYEAMAGVLVNLEGGVDELRVGVPENGLWDNLEPDVRFYCRGAVQVIGAVGAKPREIRVPDAAELLQVAGLTLLYEGARELGRHSSRAKDFGEDVWDRIEQGRRITDEMYVKAQVRRAELNREWGALWSEVDLLMLPATPLVAFRIDEPRDLRPETTRLTRPFNLLGWPAVSLPCGLSGEGLPVGIQLVAAPGKEELLLRAAAALEAGVKIPIKKRPS
jgi:aspartyl-tRNA(Asn)/glutamyl-tRNA(Gln) amidotransferase subunit A